jgi:hypothetical protein
MMSAWVRSSRTGFDGSMATQDIQLDDSYHYPPDVHHMANLRDQTLSFKTIGSQQLEKSSNSETRFITFLRTFRAASPASFSPQIMDRAISRFRTPSGSCRSLTLHSFTKLFPVPQPAKKSITPRFERNSAGITSHNSSRSSRILSLGSNWERVQEKC